MSDTDHDDDHAGHYIVPPKYYMINAVVITVLMALTVFAAKGMDLPGGVNGLNLWLALAIAVAKAGFIVAIFMGVKWNTPLVKMFALCAVAWLMIMFVFTLVDYASPSWGLGTPYTDYANPGLKPLP
jgi:cytochrome c oxidase subunit IV